MQRSTVTLPDALEFRINHIEVAARVVTIERILRAAKLPLTITEIYDLTRKAGHELNSRDAIHGQLTRLLNEKKVRRTYIYEKRFYCGRCTQQKTSLWTWRNV